MKKILKGLGIALVAVFVIGVFAPKEETDSPDVAPNNASVEADAKPRVEPGKASIETNAKTDDDAKADAEPEYIEISATELLEAYDTNEVSADNNYRDKLLKVTGTVGSIGKDILDNAYVTLTNDNNQYSFISVQCFFAKNNLEGVAELEEGDAVTITGKCSGGTFNVILKKCDVVTD